MKFAKLNTLACAAVLALCASQASAIGVFTINPSAIPGNVFAISPFQATSLSGNTSELLNDENCAQPLAVAVLPDRCSNSDVLPLSDVA